MANAVKKKAKLTTVVNGKELPSRTKKYYGRATSKRQTADKAKRTRTYVQKSGANGKMRIEDIVRTAHENGAQVSVQLIPIGEEPKKNLLENANSIIYGDREKTYGHPALNLQTIAEMWTVYLHRKAAVERAKSPLLAMMTGPGDHLPEITINDVCQMMVLLKTARLLNDPTHLDSLTDQAGYVALQERCFG